jgi:DNA-binding transcriptional MerR regulator
MSVRILTLFDIEPIDPPATMVVKKKRATTPHSLESAPAKKPKEPTAPTQALSGTDEKNYYSIGEVAKKFKVRTSHIRFWTVQFGMKVRTTRKGDRLYTPEDIEKLKAIHHLVKDQGFTIAGAKAKLKEAKNTNTEAPQNSTIVQAVQNLKATLLSLSKQIAQL